MKKTSIIKASAGTVVVVSVVTGVVLWKQGDNGPEGRVEAGMRGIASKGSFEVSRTGEEIEQLRREKEALSLEKEQLIKDKEELEKKAADLGEKVKALEEKASAGDKKPASDRKLAVSFGYWGDMEELSGVNWREMGEAAEKISQLAKGVVESDGEISPDLGVKIATENQKLVPLALKVNGKFPTHASGNGEFTHPMLHWNLLRERLDVAGVPLSETQVARISRLGEEYDAQWERLQGSYSTDALELEKIIDELEIKKTFTDKLEALLTREQREVIVDPAIHNVYALDVQSPMLIVVGRCRSVSKDSKEGIRKQAITLWSERWNLESPQVEAKGAVFDGWLSDVDSRLAPVPARLVEWFNINDAIVSGRAQIKVMKEFLSSSSLEESSRKKITGEMIFLVPRLVAKE